MFKLILNATNREPERSIVGEHAGNVGMEGDVAGTRTTLRTGPIVAGQTDTLKLTIAEDAEARQGQLKG